MKLGPESDYNLRLAPNRATMTIQGWERFQKSQGQINRKFLAEAKLSLKQEDQKFLASLKSSE